jgi:hypothetical protein
MNITLLQKSFKINTLASVLLFLGIALSTSVFGQQSDMVPTPAPPAETVAPPKVDKNQASSSFVIEAKVANGKIEFTNQERVGEKKEMEVAPQVSKTLVDNGYFSYEASEDEATNIQRYNNAKEELYKRDPQKYAEWVKKEFGVEMQTPNNSNVEPKSK